MQKCFVILCQVPTWRVILIKKRWQIEGTEDLSDEYYEALHCKPEANEKRRQRCDYQRQREAAYCDQLRDREKKSMQVCVDILLLFINEFQKSHQSSVDLAHGRKCG